MSRRAQAAPAVLASALLAKLAPVAGMEGMIGVAADLHLVLRPKLRVRRMAGGQCSATFRWVQSGGHIWQSVTVRFSRALLDGVPRV